MNYRVVKKENGLEIEVSKIEGKERQLLNAFRECSEGRCGCPTKEYAKIDILKVEEDPGMIRLRLKAKKGQQFDEAEIRHCLDYTDDRLSQVRSVTFMGFPISNRWRQRVVVFGALYLGLGVISAILTNTIQAETPQAVMRVGVLLLGIVVLVIHLHYEIRRFHNTTRGSSLLASGAVSFGTFFLAVYANLTDWFYGSEFRFSLILALMIWPVVTGLLTFPVALVLAKFNMRKR